MSAVSRSSHAVPRRADKERGASVAACLRPEGRALDPETLDVVADAPERVRHGERMVGVIGHVPALAERVPDGLVLAKNGGASTVTPRWHGATLRGHGAVHAPSGQELENAMDRRYFGLNIQRVQEHSSGRAFTSRTLASFPVISRPASGRRRRIGSSEALELDEFVEDDGRLEFAAAWLQRVVRDRADTDPSVACVEPFSIASFICVEHEQALATAARGFLSCGEEGRADSAATGTSIDEQLDEFRTVRLVLWLV
jgi:hypothetical protein